MTSFDKKSTAEELAKFYSKQIEGKTILITGVTSNSLGAEFVKTIVQHSPSIVILAGRSTEKLKEMKNELENKKQSITQIEFVILQLDDQEQIKKSSNEINQKYYQKIDILINNAALMGIKDFQITKQGIEMQFGVNHIGHFLFTNLILPSLNTSKNSVRIVNVSSDGYRLSPIRFDDWNFGDGNRYDPWRAYGQSKTANIFFSLELNRKKQEKWKNILSISLHPGAIRTNLGRSITETGWNELIAQDLVNGHNTDKKGFEYKTLQQGAATHVFAAFHPFSETEMEENNDLLFAQDCQLLRAQEMFSWGRDPVDAEKLWKLSESILNEKFE